MNARSALVVFLSIVFVSVSVVAIYMVWSHFKVTVTVPKLSWEEQVRRAIPNAAYVRPLSEGYAEFRDGETQKWGYIRYDGQIVIGAQYDFAAPFSEGRAYVLKSGIHQVIDNQGAVVFWDQAGEVASIGYFHRGVAAVEFWDGSRRTIDTNGKWVGPLQASTAPAHLTKP